MSTNRFREEEKVDFANMTPEEQKEYSRKHISREQNERPLNEELSEINKEKDERERARRIQ